MDRITQNAKIVSYLRQNRSATARDLFINCGVNSPRKRISELTRDGYPIISLWDEYTDEFGDRVRFKRYYLEG